jgi:hypothetical protein
MMRFDGTLARQLDLIEVTDTPAPLGKVAGPQPTIRPARRDLRLLKQDVYAEIVRRRRRAQIDARHQLAK